MQHHLLLKNISMLINKGQIIGDHDERAEALAEAALADKKRSGGTIPLIIPTEIGHCEIIPTPVEELTAFVKAGQ